MWKAVIKELNEESVPNDTVNMGVQYTSDSGKTFTKSYNLHAGSYSTAQAVQDLITNEIKHLEAFEAVVEAVKQVKDQATEITKDTATIVEADIEIKEGKK